ncbi:hypothetical protein CVU37_04770 [candidate division BRC1 bacterium HGW-BRC1-1]|jgi:hypothetical protein|nr:MAG: hypothetical protein CVU37_04770 [candidate division BRC1 bacterium HGW-BRC1-1]
MPTFKIAHIREQGQDIILALVSDQIHYKGDTEKAALAASLQACAEAAGLAGIVVLVWIHVNQIYFRGPSPWHAFLKGLTVPFFMSNINKELTCK